MQQSCWQRISIGSRRMIASCRYWESTSTKARTRSRGAEKVARHTGRVAPISTVVTSKMADAIWLARKRFQISSYKRAWSEVSSQRRPWPTTTVTSPRSAIRSLQLLPVQRHGPDIRVSDLAHLHVPGLSGAVLSAAGDPGLRRTGRRLVQHPRPPTSFRIPR